MATKKDKKDACVILQLRDKAGDWAHTRISASLGARDNERDGDGFEFPISPDNVNGLECDHGALCVLGYVFDDGAKSPVSINAPEYERVGYADLYKIEGLHKTLSTLKKRLEKFREARGYVQSWTEHVLRFAEACGAKTIAFPAALVARIDRQNGRERPRDLRGERFVFLDPQQAREELDALVASFAPASDIAASVGAAS